MTASSAQAAPVAKTRPTTLEEGAGALFSHCLSAFQAFQGLSQLSEDMRILSLNAELAAGRAGTAGVAVRALTQYTRQLVSQLNRLDHEMEELKSSTHTLSEATTAELKKLQDVRETRSQIPGDSDMTRDSLRKEEGILLQSAGGQLGKMMENARRLGVQAARIRQVADQSNGIATNIAIEAAAAGRYESEFRTVSDTMKRYILTLQTMVEKANHAVRLADETGQAVSRRLAAASARLDS